MPEVKLLDSRLWVLPVALAHQLMLEEGPQLSAGPRCRLSCLLLMLMRSLLHPLASCLQMWICRACPQVFACQSPVLFKHREFSAFRTLSGSVKPHQESNDLATRIRGSCAHLSLMTWKRTQLLYILVINERVEALRSDVRLQKSGCLASL